MIEKISKSELLQLVNEDVIVAKINEIIEFAQNTKLKESARAIRIIPP